MRTDNAPTFKSIKLEKDKALTDLNVKTELSKPLNKNGKACVNKVISNLITEIRKITPEETLKLKVTLSKALLKVNNDKERRKLISK